MKIFLTILGCIFGFIALTVAALPLNSLPNVQQKEAVYARCSQLHGQLEFISERGGEIRNINCVTPTGYYSMYKSEEVHMWEKRYLHPQNGEIFD